MRTTVFSIAILTALTGPSAAQQQRTTVTTPMPERPPEQQNLAAAVLDPTAMLMQVSLAWEWQADFWDVNGDASSAVFRGIVPFRAFGLANLMELRVPYRFDDPTSEGLDRVLVSDSAVFRFGWGRLSAGLIAGLSPRQLAGDMDLGPEGGFQAGPTVGAVTHYGPWIFGALNQNLFGDESTSMLQPIVGFTPNPHWSFGLAELPITYDWEANQFPLFPLGVQANFVSRLGGQYTRFFVQPLYNIAENSGQPRWIITFGAALLSPTG